MIKGFKNFNKARNKLIHNLWKYGYSDLNKKSKNPSLGNFYNKPSKKSKN